MHAAIARARHFAACFAVSMLGGLCAAIAVPTPARAADSEELRDLEEQIAAERAAMARERAELEARVDEALRRAVGALSLPYLVGADGFIFLSNFEVFF